MLPEFEEALAPHVRGKSLLQLGFRPQLNDNAAVIAAAYGAAKASVMTDPTRRELIQRIGRAVLRDGCDFAVHELPVEDIKSGGDPRRSDIAFCDDLLFKVHDPYRMLSGLRRLVREKLFLSANVVPTAPPANAANGSWPIAPGFAAFAGALADEDRANLAEALRAYGLDTASVGPGAATRPDPDGYSVAVDSWRWYWTEEALIELVDAAGFTVTEVRYVWSRVGLLLVCS
jgi:hypothetical protein